VVDDASLPNQGGLRKAAREDKHVDERVSSLSTLLCTIPQAAAMIGRGQTFIYGAIGDGRLEAVKSDKRTLIVVKSLYKYAAELPPAKIKPLPKRKHHHRRTR
jgi:hypothetical protein